MRTGVGARWFLLLGLLAATGRSQDVPAPGATDAQEPPRTVLKTTVRRVALDVTVTDSKGAPVAGLTQQDFAVTENNQPQKILSFDTNGFSEAMDYVPPALPPQPPNTFLNLPATVEKGPLYVLLYDLADMDDPGQKDTPGDHHVQMEARQAMLRFVQSKPEGTRFAVFVRSDGLHLLQGFTAGKQTLYAALDPHKPRPHMPMVFLAGVNYGAGNRLGALDTLHRIAVYLDGMPGRKNLIWFSAMFPLSLFAEQNDGPNFQEETRATLDLLARNQIAVYPVDARGVSIQDSHTYVGTAVHNGSVTSALGSAPAGATSISGGSSPTAGSSQGGSAQGESATVGSYNVMDEIARETGGQAFYGSNDVAGELEAATRSGGVFYTLTYAPSDPNFDGKLRRIEVKLAKKGYQLSYRRSYYGTELPDGSAGVASVAPAALSPGDSATAVTGRPVGDSLSAEMQHGAPTEHRLLFVVQAATEGPPLMGTPEQMAELATEPAYFKSRRHSAAVKPLSPVPLQKDAFNFEIPTRQFAGESLLDLEVAAAAFDADGQMMNAVVRVARKDLEAKGDAAQGGAEKRFFRVQQELQVPVGAVSLRFAVRDRTNDRIGAMEVALPLADAGPAGAAGR